MARSYGLVALLIVACAVSAHGSRVLLQDTACTTAPSVTGVAFPACTLTAGSSCTGTCADGYTGSGATATCDGTTGTWTVTSTCVENACTGLPSAVSAVFDLSCSTAAGYTCTGTCATGYSGSASFTVTCSAGAWDLSNNDCKADCTTTPTTDGAAFSCGTKRSGESCSATCTDPYEGTAEAKCVDGTWSIEEECKKKRCQGSPTMTDGAFACGDSSPIDNVCTAKCTHKCKGSFPKSRCQIDGTWSTPDSTCCTAAPQRG